MNKIKTFSHINVLAGLSFLIFCETVLFIGIFIYHTLIIDNFILIIIVSVLSAIPVFVYNKKSAFKAVVYSVLFLLIILALFTQIFWPFKTRYAKTGNIRGFLLLPFPYVILSFLAGIKLYEKKRTGLYISKPF